MMNFKKQTTVRFLLKTQNLNCDLWPFQYTECYEEVLLCVWVYNNVCVYIYLIQVLSIYVCVMGAVKFILCDFVHVC